MGNPNFEIRNPKEARIPNWKGGRDLLRFRISMFGIPSDSGFRSSDFFLSSVGGK